jgi:hypothetical protein
MFWTESPAVGMNRASAFRAALPSVHAGKVSLR